VDSTAGFSVGDWVDVGTGTNSESVKLTAVTETSIRGVFLSSHSSGDPVRLYALPYVTGVIPPTGMGANAQGTATTLRFFGDINGDSTVQYVEYVLDGANNQITRSITPVGQGSKGPAIPFIRNIAPGSVQFTLYSDVLGVITSVDVAFTVQNSSRGAQNQLTQLASKATIPSTIAASALTFELLQFQGINRLPSTPPQVTTWASYEEQ
jgi:hypothetical protein